MAAVLTVALVGSALFAWFSVFWLVPSNLRGMFRYLLWRLRDALADDIHAGKFERTAEPLRVIEAIECFIECAEELTVLRIGLLMAFVRPQILKSADRPRPLSLKGLGKSDQELLGTYIRRFNEIVTRQVFFGSLSGWVASAIVFPAIYLLRLYDRANKKESPVAYEVKRRTTEASLSALAASHVDEIHHQEPLSTFGN